MIQGLTVLRNALEGGYPFVEAIRSALPLCESIVVQDGHSSDGTWEVLQRLAAREPRVELHREPWSSEGAGHAIGGGEPIRNALNSAKSRIRADWIFQFDANEFLPAEDVPILRELPETHPRRELFALPYRQFAGRYWFNEEFRFRLVRNLPTIRALYDGWTFGYRLGPSDLLRPKEFWRIVGRTAHAVLQDRVAVDLPERHIHLPRPIHRYYGLFPEAFLRKMQTKVDLQRNPSYRALTADAPRVDEILRRYESDHDYDRFWSSIIELQRGANASSGSINKEFPYLRLLPDLDHPPEIRRWFGTPRYVPEP